MSNKQPRNIGHIHSDVEALKIHGYIPENSTDSESGKSDFDEEFYKHKPPPIEIDKHKIVIVRNLVSNKHILSEKKNFKTNKSEPNRDETYYINSHTGATKKKIREKKDMIKSREISSRVVSPVLSNSIFVINKTSLPSIYTSQAEKPISSMYMDFFNSNKTVSANSNSSHSKPISFTYVDPVKLNNGNSFANEKIATSIVNNQQSIKRFSSVDKSNFTFTDTAPNKPNRYLSSDSSGALVGPQPHLSKIWITEEQGNDKKISILETRRQENIKKDYFKEDKYKKPASKKIISEEREVRRYPPVSHEACYSQGQPVTEVVPEIINETCVTNDEICLLETDTGCNCCIIL